MHGTRMYIYSDPRIAYTVSDYAGEVWVRPDRGRGVNLDKMCNALRAWAVFPALLLALPAGAQVVPPWPLTSVPVPQGYFPSSPVPASSYGAQVYFPNAPYPLPPSYYQYGAGVHQWVAIRLHCIQWRRYGPLP